MVAPMAATDVAVHLYWNGTAKTEKYDVVYESDAMKVLSSTMELRMLDCWIKSTQLRALRGRILS